MLRALIRFLAPGLMNRIEVESRTWMMHCTHCGCETSIWDAGGMRYKGLGTVYRLGRCRNCGKISMLRVYKRNQPAGR